MRVDFYEMSGRFTDPLFVTGVLIGRAWPGTSRIAVVATAATLEQLDARLWEEPSGRFLPHARAPERAPIQLAENAPDHAEILINLDPTAALPDGRYDRVLEIIPPDEQIKQQLRQRWMHWKQRGADVHHHVLK